MYDIITMGSSTIDAFANTEAEIIEIKTKNTEEELIAYPMGSKIPIKEMRYDVGGNGVNVAVGCSRLGFKTAFLGKVGSDINGNSIIERLKQEKIDFIGSREGQSGFSVILDTELGPDRTILGFKGCNNKLKYKEIDLKKIKTKWIYLTSMLEESYTSLKKMAEYAKKQNIKIAFNPSKTVSRYGFDFLKPVLEKTDLLIVNDEEAEDIVGKGTPKEKLIKLHKLGIPTVFVTLGEKGLLAYQDGKIYDAKPSKNVIVCETTGAGDACSSGILTGFVRGDDIETCIKRGMNNSESVLCSYGAHNHLLNDKEMKQKLRKDKRVLKQV